jgi:hypothetical protein
MNEIKDLTQKVDRILYYLESDPKTKQEGLVEKVNRIDADLENLLIREKVYVAKFSSAAFFGGAVFTGLWAFIKFIFKL